MLCYDIFRDGDLIAEQLDVNRYRDAALMPSTTYHYQVVAIDDDCNRSSLADLTLTTPADSPQSGAATISAANYEALITEVLNVYTGRAYQETVLSLPQWPLPDFQPTRVPDVDAIIYAYDETYVCGNGGTVTFEYTYQNFGRSGATLHVFDIDQCQQDALVLDGLLSTEDTGSGPRFWSDSYSISDPSFGAKAVRLTFAGEVVQDRGSRAAPSLRSRETRDVRLTWHDGIGERIVEEANTYYVTDSGLPHFGEASMQGTVSIQSPLAANRWIRAEVTTLFKTTPSYMMLDSPGDALDQPWRFTHGRLQLTADDGSHMVFDAGNDDFDTVDIEIVSPGGDRVDLSAHRWDPWIDLLPLQGYPNQ